MLMFIQRVEDNGLAWQPDNFQPTGRRFLSQYFDRVRRLENGRAGRGLASERVCIAQVASLGSLQEHEHLSELDFSVTLRVEGHRLGVMDADGAFEWQPNTDACTRSPEPSRRHTHLASWTGGALHEWQNQFHRMWTRASAFFASAL